MSKGPVKVLRECIELQEKKGADYQAASSSVRQADYYIRGVDTIYDTMHGKMLRMRSLMDRARSGDNDPNFESLEDSAKDLINYASFFVAWIRGEIDGQEPGYDIFNRKTVDFSVIPELTIGDGPFMAYDVNSLGYGTTTL